LDEFLKVSPAFPSQGLFVISTFLLTLTVMAKIPASRKHKRKR